MGTAMLKTTKRMYNIWAVLFFLLVLQIGNGWEFIEWGNGIIIKIVIGDHSLVPYVSHQ